jgi:hypothetical protein
VGTVDSQLKLLSELAQTATCDAGSLPLLLRPSNRTFSSMYLDDVSPMSDECHPSCIAARRLAAEDRSREAGTLEATDFSEED